MAKKKSGQSKNSKAANKRLPMAALMQLNEAQVMADDGDWAVAHQLLTNLNQL